MKKRLYHGSQFIIQKPEYGKGKKEKADINEPELFTEQYLN